MTPFCLSVSPRPLHYSIIARASRQHKKLSVELFLTHAHLGESDLVRACILFTADVRRKRIEILSPHTLTLQGISPTGVGKAVGWIGFLHSQTLARKLN